MLLLACSDCHRQYDVTGLEAGARVRCLCDRVLDVGWPEELTGEALTCTHCGGAVTVAAEACPYCAAQISERDRRSTTLCPECFTRLADDSKHCRACGVAIAPQALAPLPAGRACPRCEGELGSRALEHADVIECLACEGLWLRPDSFVRTLREAERASEVPPLAEEQPPRPEIRELDAVRYIPCLTCGELMNRRQYIYGGRSTGVVIDQCRHHGVWLDRDELASLVAVVREGRAPRIPVRPPGAEDSTPSAASPVSTRSALGGSVLETLASFLFGHL